MSLQQDDCLSLLLPALPHPVASYLQIINYLIIKVFEIQIDFMDDVLLLYNNNKQNKCKIHSTSKNKIYFHLKKW